jgi:hypothetical protein
MSDKNIPPVDPETGPEYFKMIKPRQLAELVRMDHPESVLDEVLEILKSISPDFDTAPISSTLDKIVDLYEGRWPGYQACNTEYHDLKHITDTFLATVRLVHGAINSGIELSERHIITSLIATLAHDTGYIQREDDLEGTGAKYTTTHVRLSIGFLQRHGAEFGLSDEETVDAGTMILCTDLSVVVPSVSFPSPEIELLSKILGTTDLLAQMGDRVYLEKLLFLYYEFKEGNAGDYEGEVDLLHKTIGFYDFVFQRLETVLDNVQQYMAAHFAARWGINKDLYQIAIDFQKAYLENLFIKPDIDPRMYLRRDGIVEKVHEKYGDQG